MTLPASCPLAGEEIPRMTPSKSRLIMRIAGILALVGRSLLLVGLAQRF
jgi:hypothetical protein